MKIPSSIWTLLVGILLTLVSLWYGQNHGLLPIAASDEATLVDGLFNTMMTVSVGIFLLVEGTLIYSAFKYRQRAGDNADGPPVHGNVPLEILWTGIPAIIVIGLSVYSFDVYNSMGGFDPHSIHEVSMTPQAMRMPGAAIAATLSDTATSTEPNLNQQKSDEAMQDPATARQLLQAGEPFRQFLMGETPKTGLPHQRTALAVRNADQIPQRRNAPGLGISDPTLGSTPENQGKPPALVVNVTGLQYAWIFTYPETGVTSGELHVPIGRQVEMSMTASDVIHAFWVPEFRLKQDVIPGRQSEIRFTPSKLGDYTLICAELCGPYHGAMRTQVVVETQSAFDQWIQEQLVASTEDLKQAVAVNPHTLSPDEFLSPYTSQMGIQPEIVHHIHK